MTLFKWSQTAANNGTADTTCPFPENMAASAYNDGMRGAMAAVAKYRDDTAGLIVTGGTSTAYTVSSFQGFTTLALLHGQVVWFTPHTTNGATVLLNVDSLGGKPLRSALGVELQSAVLIQGTPYGAVYNNTDGAFYLQGLYGNLGVPFLGGIDFWDTVTPSSAFIFPAGQALSRTVYAAAFARWGTTFGAGDGSTTFNVPDKTGRVSAMKEAAATRLTSTYFGGNSTQIGAVGGGESNALVTANLPAYTPAGTNTAVLAQLKFVNQQFGNSSGNTNVPIAHDIGDGVGNFLNGASNTPVFTGTAQGGTSTPLRTLPPMIACNYVIRVL